MNRQLHNTLKLETDIESKELIKKNGCHTLKNTAAYDFPGMKTNTSELYFTIKMPGCLEHISLLIQCLISGFSNKGHGRRLKASRGSPKSSFSACHVINEPKYISY